MQIYSSNIVECLVDLTERVINNLKPTPQKAHYTFTWRDVLKVVNAMSMIEPNGLKHQVDVMKLLYHESLRNFSDRVLMKHDKKWFAN